MIPKTTPILAFTPKYFDTENFYYTNCTNRNTFSTQVIKSALLKHFSYPVCTS